MVARIGVIVITVRLIPQTIAVLFFVMEVPCAPAICATMQLEAEVLSQGPKTVKLETGVEECFA